jgi:hypothetical protein
MTQIMLQKLISPHHKCSSRHASGLVQTAFTEMVRRLNFTGSVEDLVGRFKEDHRHADSFRRD